MTEYPETYFDRVVGRVIDEENNRFLDALEAAQDAAPEGERVCPNCLKWGEGWCWLCTEKDGSNARDPKAWREAQKRTHKKENE